LRGLKKVGIFEDLQFLQGIGIQEFFGSFTKLALKIILMKNVAATFSGH
jgi:hypothetical protein